MSPYEQGRPEGRGGEHDFRGGNDPRSGWDQGSVGFADDDDRGFGGMQGRRAGGSDFDGRHTSRDDDRGFGGLGMGGNRGAWDRQEGDTHEHRRGGGWTGMGYRGGNDDRGELGWQETMGPRGSFGGSSYPGASFGRGDRERGGMQGSFGYGGSEAGRSGYESARPGSSGEGARLGAMHGFGRGGDTQRDFGGTDRDMGGGSHHGGSGPFSQDQGASHRGKGPKGYQRSDERVKEIVSEHLMDHPRIDASEITVEAKGGEITLTGTVQDRETKRMIEREVEQLTCVDDVINNLRIKRQETSSGADRNGNGSKMSGKSETKGYEASKL